MMIFSHPSSSRRLEALLPVLLVAVASALRLPGIASRSLWLDEAWRANVLLVPGWDAFWTEVLAGALPGRIGAPMPPLFALAVRGCARLLGASEAALRLLPLAASVLGVPLAYVVARRWLGRFAAAVAAWCFACHAAPVLHGQELKQYPVDVLTVLTALWVTGRVLEAPDRTRRWVALGVWTALVPGLSYPAALVLPGLALASLPATVGRTGARIRWAGAYGIGLAAAGAWYVVAIAPQRARPQVTAYWADGFPAADAGAVAWAGGQLLGFARYAYGEPAWLFAGVAAVGVLVLPSWLRTATLVTLGTSVAAAVAGLYPLSAGRTSMFLLPFWTLALAAIVGRLAPARRRTVPARAGSEPSDRARTRPLARAARGVAAASVGVLVLLPARAALDVHPVVEETRPLVEWLVAARRLEDRVYVYYGAVPAFRFYHPSLDAGIRLGVSHRGDVPAYARELHPLLQPGVRVWLLFSHVVPTAGGASERSAILADVTPYGRELAVRETVGASLHLFQVERAPGSVRHLKLTPDELRDPARLRELMRRRP